jgi:hypothetical protein
MQVAIAAFALCLLFHCQSAADERLSAAALEQAINLAEQPTFNSAFYQREGDQEAAQPEMQPPPSSGLDPGLVSAGQSAFQESCTTCHDAQRSLSKSKTYAGWLATTQRMAAREGADIRSADIVPIATYLTSVAGPSAAAAAGGITAAGVEEGGGWSFGATISTLHRSASDEAPLEFPGFFADVWLSASYQATGPWRASVTACTSCHSGTGFTFELVEGSATLDLRHCYNGCRCDDGREILLKAGRFVVPFGAFAAMSHPGIYRTVSNPLMFNMGRRVFVPGSSPPQQPVLPAPFSDEGIDLIFRTPVLGDLMFTLDLYAVNGLQGNGPNIFLRSRAYYDNNEEPTVGGRMTLGGDLFRLGASVLGGNLQDQGLERAYYTMAGADVTAQLHERLRFYFEYAMRRQDSAFVLDEEENTYGIVAELELRVWEHPNISLLIRHDTLEHRNPTFGDASLKRFTSGINIGLPGGSLLMINHELWNPEIGDDVDLFGVRWVVSL